MTLSQEEIAFIRNYFSQKPVNRAFVFGSYSRDTADAESDLDLLVELDYSQHIGLGFAAMKSELEQGLKKPVDLVPSDAVSSRIRPHIEADKKVIYERKHRG